MEIKIGEEEQDLRLDRFLRKQLKELTLSEIYQMIKNGDILVNKKPKNPAYKLQPGDTVFIPFDFNPNSIQPEIPSRELKRLKILYSDNYIVLADKPPGIPVHRGSGWNYGFFDVVEKKMGQIYPLHRLDRDTSGIMIFARKRAIARRLSEDLKKHRIERTYIALVKGYIEKEGSITAPLEKKKAGVSISSNGKEAVTFYRPVRAFDCCTLLELTLRTGRTHQIRVHMAELGHPLAGDWRYGDREFNIKMKKLGLKRLFLHSWKIKLTHPATGKIVEITSPLPEDINKILEKLS